MSRQWPGVQTGAAVGLATGRHIPAVAPSDSRRRPVFHREIPGRDANFSRGTAGRGVQHCGAGRLTVSNSHSLSRVRFSFLLE